MTLTGCMNNFQKIPFNNIIRFGQRSMLDRPLFNISWILGRFCNYKCSYCWPYANSQILDYQLIDLYLSVVDQIKQQAQENGFTEFHWSFSGGEPTAYKQLLHLLKYVRNDTIHLTTNLSPGVSWWENWLTSTSTFSRRSITASYHAEFASEDEFIKKILFLMDNDVYVTVNQVMVPTQFTELYQRCIRMKQFGINVTLKPQSNITASSIVDGYTDSMIDIMQTEFIQSLNSNDVYQIALYDTDNTEYLFDQAERFNAYNFNKFKDWKCNAGYQSVVIRGNEVKRAYSCHEQILGTLDSFNLFSSAQLCTTSSCVSSADSKIPKSK